MPIIPYRRRAPRLGQRVFVAPTAYVIGEVDVADDVSLWFGSVTRGDVNSIRIGARTTIQDGAVLHVTHERYSLSVGADVVVAHGVILHGCTIEDGSLIGIGARVLDGAVVETGAQIGAGSVVVPGQRIPAGSVALGTPAKVVRSLRPEEVQEIRRITERYLQVKDSYRETIGDGIASGD